MMKSATKALRGPGWTRWIASTGAKLPRANTIVANRISHGTRLAKMVIGVHNSRSAPISPPTRLKANKLRTLNSATAMILRRYAHAPANVPENSDDARCIRIDGTKPSKQEGRKCHQGSAAGERVQGSAEERGDNEDDGSHEMRYVWSFASEKSATVEAINGCRSRRHDNDKRINSSNTFGRAAR